MTKATCQHKNAVCFATRNALNADDAEMWPDRYHLCRDCGAIGWEGQLDGNYHETWISLQTYGVNLGDRGLGKKATLLIDAQRNRLKSP